MKIALKGAPREAVFTSGRPFQLVITDLIMPGMNGLTLMQAIAVSPPDLPVMLCTGYAEDLDAPLRAELTDDCRLLRKPFTRAELARAVRYVLDHA